PGVIAIYKHHPWTIGMSRIANSPPRVAYAVRMSSSFTHSTLRTSRCFRAIIGPPPSVQQENSLRVGPFETESRIRPPRAVPAIAQRLDLAGLFAGAPDALQSISPGSR